MTSSTKREIYNILQHRLRRTEPQPQAMCIKICWSSAAWFLSYVSGQTDRQSDIFITIPGIPSGSKVTILPNSLCCILLCQSSSHCIITQLSPSLFQTMAMWHSDHNSNHTFIRYKIKPKRGQQPSRQWAVKGQNCNVPKYDFGDFQSWCSMPMVCFTLKVWHTLSDLRPWYNYCL